jgi:hypothetical protein
VTGLAERLRLFEPLLDELAAEFRLEAIGPMEPRGDPVSDAYHRCEVKRHRIGKACASDGWAVLDHADEIMHAIAHDHCPSGNRQLIQPLVEVLGARQVMERVLRYMETGSATERLGAAMAWYWASPTLQYSTLDEFQNDAESGVVASHSLVPGEVTPSGRNAEARTFTREFRPRIRAAYLRAFLASEDPGDCRHFSQFLSLSLDDYPVELHPEVEAARKVAELHPERFKQGSHGGWSI